MSHRLLTVDIRDFSTNKPTDAVDTLRKGFVEDGFVLVTGFGGVFKKRYEPYHRARTALFELDDSVLAQYERPDIGRQRGFTGFQVEHAKHISPDLADLKRLWMTRLEEWPDDPNDNPFGKNIWPSEVPDFRPTSLGLMSLLIHTGRTLLRGLEKSYGFPEGHLVSMTRGSETMLRAIHYPPVGMDAPEGAVRSAEHEDINLITILRAEAGLELRIKGEWVALDVPEGEYLVADIGDMLAVVEGMEDLIPTTHRVVNPTGTAAHTTRFNDPCFIHARRSVWLNSTTKCGPWIDQRLRDIGVAA